MKRLDGKGTDMHLELDGEGPKYLQLSRAIRSAVQEGRIANGARLPPTRELAQVLGLARNTVRGAYEHLGTTRLLHGRVGAGSFVNTIGPSTRPSTAAVPAEAPSGYARRTRALMPEFIGWA